MKPVLLLILFVFSVDIHGQNSIDREFFLDSLKNPVLENDYVYKRIVRNYYAEQNEYQFTDFYRSGAVQMTAKSSSKECRQLKGIAVTYYENGQEQEQAYYESGIQLGDYLSWYPNGQQKIIGEYLKNKEQQRKVGELKIIQFWNAENVQKVTDGMGYFKGQESEDILIEGKVKDGIRDSIWTGRDNKLNFTFSEEYQNGVLVLGTSTDSFGTSHTYKTKEVSPVYPGGVDAFYNYIAKHFVLPSDLDRISGRIFYSFVINKNGKTEDVKILRGIHPRIDAIGKKLIEDCALWKPAKRRGIACKILYSIPVMIGR